MLTSVLHRLGHLLMADHEIAIVFLLLLKDYLLNLPHAVHLVMLRIFQKGTFMLAEHHRILQLIDICLHEVRGGHLLAIVRVVVSSTIRTSFEELVRVSDLFDEDASVWLAYGALFGQLE